jgi:nitrogenase subunit NifH
MATVAKGDVVEFVIVKSRESRLEWAFCDDDAGGVARVERGKPRPGAGCPLYTGS